MIGFWVFWALIACLILGFAWLTWVRARRLAIWSLIARVCARILSSWSFWIIFVTRGTRIFTWRALLTFRRRRWFIFIRFYTQYFLNQSFISSQLLKDRWLLRRICLNFRCRFSKWLQHSSIWIIRTIRIITLGFCLLSQVCFVWFVRSIAVVFGRLRRGLMLLWLIFWSLFLEFLSPWSAVHELTSKPNHEIVDVEPAGISLD